VEEDLYAGNYSSARSILSSITTTNNVEANYKNFYRLYANFEQAVDEDATYSADDAADLQVLAQLCPEAGGSCIHQARALYNAIFNTIVNYNDDCNASTGGERLAHYTDEAQTNSSTIVKEWSVDLFPNPATNQVNIVSKQENESLNLVILDVTGRVMLKQALKTNGFIATLELNLLNGAYMAIITNSSGKTVTKKLLIAR